MTTIEFNGTELTVGETTIEVSKPIKDAIIMDGFLVVLLEADGQQPAESNVVAYRTDGTVRWYVEPVTAPTNDTNMYVSIWKEGGELWAADWKGTDYKLSKESGSQIETRFRK